ncbi:AAA family ATPase [Exilibacterium tricleocarpae]|uniref:AAA family ATPase n=1 Tax=Exilibacterium tricleocarpae TaxID=2591008 RepID=A0A545T5Z1_9GAMM|nr:AAA family ATPase [Exilibacterium tricleocarpae]TQV72650.1 AAA family ATPase [Exilibacterium tricleocarpae]
MAVETELKPARGSGSGLTPTPPQTPTGPGGMVDWLAALGLTQDPFAADNPPFFDAAGRGQLLEQLLHHCQFSASALVVLGEAGAGKSTLLRELLNHLGSNDAVCCVDVPAIYDAEQVLADVVGDFGLVVPEDAGRGQLLSEIRHFGQTGEEGALALLVVDNAHHLDDQLLAALLSLLQGQDDAVRPLHLVLFGDPSLALRLDAFGIVDVLIHDMVVAPFERDEVAQYLDFCLAQAGYDGEPLFTDVDIDHLWQASKGLPGQLNPLARRHLIEAVTPAPAARRRPLLPLGHALVVTALGAVLLMALFYGEGEPPAPVAGAPQAPAAEVAEAADIAAVKPPAAQPPATAEPPQMRPATPPSPAGTTASRSRDRVADLEPVVPDRELRRLPAPAAGTPGNAAADTPPPRQPPAAAGPDWSADETQLLAQAASAYTLQVLAAGSADSVREFVARQADAAALQVFTTRRAGRDWYVVVHGSFPDAASARRAIAALPQALREAGPWPRSMASVQTEIKEYRRN